MSDQHSGPCRIGHTLCGLSLSHTVRFDQQIWARLLYELRAGVMPSALCQKQLAHVVGERERQRERERGRGGRERERERERERDSERQYGQAQRSEALDCVTVL
jgi:hypothetical protein